MIETVNTITPMTINPNTTHTPINHSGVPIIIKKTELRLTVKISMSIWREHSPDGSTSEDVVFKGTMANNINSMEGGKMESQGGNCSLRHNSLIRGAEPATTFN